MGYDNWDEFSDAIQHENVHHRTKMKRNYLLYFTNIICNDHDFHVRGRLWYPYFNASDYSRLCSIINQMNDQEEKSFRDIYKIYKSRAKEREYC